MAVPPYLKVYDDNKLSFDHCDPQTGVLTKWYHNTTNYMLGGEDVNAFEKSKNVAILMGSPMVYIPTSHYKHVRLMYPTKEDRKIYAFSIRCMYIGAIKAVEVEKEEETYVEERMVWEYKDYHNAFDIFQGTEALIHGVNLPCSSPFMVYAMLARFHPSSISMEHIGMQVPGYWEFIDWVTGCADQSRCTIANVLMHFKAFNFKAEGGVNEKIAEEFSNTDNMMLRDAKSNPQNTFDLQLLSGITNDAFIQMRCNHYDCTAFYLERADHLILVKSFGMLVCERLTMMELENLKDHLEANVCGLFSFQYMINLLRTVCIDNSAYDAILSAYENTFTTFNPFNAAAMVMYNYIRDTYAEDRPALTTEQRLKESEMVGVAYALTKPEAVEFRQKMFISERYGGGKIMKLKLVSGQESDNGFYDEDEKYTGITKTIAKNLHLWGIYAVLDAERDNQDQREKIFVPSSWVDAISNLNTLFSTMPEAITVRFWDWPDHFAHNEDILNKAAGKKMNEVHTLIICPNNSLLKQFQDATAGRFCATEEGLAYNTFRKKIVPIGTEKVASKIHNIIVLGAEMISPFRLYNLLNAFVHTYLETYDGQIVLVSDLVCARRKLPDSSFGNYLPALFERFRYQINMDYEESSSFVGDNMDIDAMRNYISYGALKVEVSYKIPDYATRVFDDLNDEKDKMVLFSRAFKNLHPSGKELILGELEGEWKGVYKLGVDHKVRRFCQYHLMDTGETVTVLGYGKGVFGCLNFAKPSKREETHGMYYRQKNAMFMIDEGSDTAHFACCAIRTAEVAIKMKDHQAVVSSKMIFSSRTAYQRYNESKPAPCCIEIRPMYHVTVPLTKIEPRMYTGIKKRIICLLCPVIEGDDVTKLRREDITLAVRYAYEKIDVVLIPFTKGENGVLSLKEEPEDSEAGTYMAQEDLDEVSSWKWIINLFKQLSIQPEKEASQENAEPVAEEIEKESSDNEEKESEKENQPEPMELETPTASNIDDLA